MPGIQIGHAGRKASANKPWEGDDHHAALALGKSEPSWVLPAPYAHWLERYRVSED